jgi:hypothetical protein
MIPGADAEEHITKQINPGAASMRPRTNQDMKYQKPPLCGIWYFFIPNIHICEYVMDVVSSVHWLYNG